MCCTLIFRVFQLMLLTTYHKSLGIVGVKGPHIILPSNRGMVWIIRIIQFNSPNILENKISLGVVKAHQDRTASA